MARAFSFFIGVFSLVTLLSHQALALQCPMNISYPGIKVAKLNETAISVQHCEQHKCSEIGEYTSYHPEAFTKVYSQLNLQQRSLETLGAGMTLASLATLWGLLIAPPTALIFGNMLEEEYMHENAVDKMLSKDELDWISEDGNVFCRENRFSLERILYIGTLLDKAQSELR